MANILNNPTFIPTQLAGCSLWLDAADINTFFQDSGGTTPITATGQSIGLWKDKSGNARNAIGSTGTATYASTALGGNLPAINITPTRNMRSPVAAGTFPTTVHGFVVFQKYGAISGFDTVVTRTIGFNASPFDMFSSTRRLGGTGGFNATGSASNVFINTTPTLFYFNINSNSRLIWNETINGTFYTYTLSGSATYNDTATSIFIGTRDSTNINMTGYISEIIFYNTTLSTAQRQQVEGYLAWKWNLQGNLPTTHPYYYTQGVANLILSKQVPNPYNNSNITLFLPTQVLGCTLWLDGADASSIIRSGNIISQWNDKSSNNYTFILGVSPTYSNNVLNKLSAVYFNGTQYLDNTLISFGSNYTFFTLGYVNVVDTSTRRLLNGGGSTADAYFSILDRSGYVLTANGNGYSGGVSLWNSIVPNTPNIDARMSWQIITALNSNYIMYPYVNGTAQDSRTGTTSGFTGLDIGGAYTDTALKTGQCLIGYIAEIIAFSNALTTIQRQQIEGYLAWKWGLQANLPATHPYYSQSILQGYPSLPAPTIGPTFSQKTLFLPSAFSGLALWLDAADRSTVTLTGSNITNVKDKSPNNLSLSNATGYRYVNSRFNGVYPSFYNGNGGFLSNNSATLGRNSAFAVTVPFTLFFVAQQTAGGPDYGTFIDSFSGSGRPYILRNSLESPFGNGSSIGTIAFQACAQFYTSARMYVNGSSLYSGSLASFTTGGITIGNRFSLSEAWPGHICEIIIYNSSITNNQRQQLEGYLAWKWGLQKSLPSSHPYYLFPPG